MLTFFIVQYTKSLVDRIAPWLPTDLFAVIVAFGIMTIAQVATGADPGDWRLYPLAFANSFLVAAAAGQMHNKAVTPPGTNGGTREGEKKNTADG